MKKLTASLPENRGLAHGAPVASNSATAPLKSYVWQAAIERRAPVVRPYQDLFKRGLDILLVLLALPFALTLIGFAALALWREGGRPFYTQTRLGQDGSRFRILKLRTMVPDAAEALTRHLANNPAARDEWNRMQKLKDDPRITPVGALLRATSLDELPQLWNVLKGDMSLVGPRPMLPEQLPLYGDPSAYFAMRPGITGLWQVSARNSEEFSSRKWMDYRYAQEVSLAKDAEILVKTVGVVFQRTGQ